MEISLLIFEGITALDAIGPYEVLSRLPGARVTFVARDEGPVRTDNGMLALVADAAMADVSRADLLLVPGGFGTRALCEDPATLDWVRAMHETTTWTTSVCTGSLVLGAAGLLEGLEATTHWSMVEALRGYGATPVARRVVEQGKIVMAAGVSAGIDMALTLTARVGGEELARAVQLAIEYDPEPPFVGGSVDNTPDEIVARVRGAISAKSPS